eukprot:5388004-Prymnesium_polylepis.1
MYAAGTRTLAVGITSFESNYRRSDPCATAVVFRIPVFREFLLLMGWREASEAMVDRMLRAGRSVIVLPGGTAEMVEMDSRREVLREWPSRSSNRAQTREIDAARRIANHARLRTRATAEQTARRRSALCGWRSSTACRSSPSTALEKHSFSERTRASCRCAVA